MPATESIAMTTLAMARHLGRRLGRGLVHLLACGLLPTTLHAATPAVAALEAAGVPYRLHTFDVALDAGCGDPRAPGGPGAADGHPR